DRRRVYTPRDVAWPNSKRERSTAPACDAAAPAPLLSCATPAVTAESESSPGKHRHTRRKARTQKAASARHPILGFVATGFFRSVRSTPRDKRARQSCDTQDTHSDTRRSGCSRAPL